MDIVTDALAACILAAIDILSDADYRILNAVKVEDDLRGFLWVRRVHKPIK